MDLIDDEDFVCSHLWRSVDLFYNLANVVNRVVGGSVQLKDIHRTPFVERLATFTFVAGLSVGLRAEAVDGLGKDARTSGLPHTARPAEKVGMSQLTIADGILQCRGKCLLSNNAVERLWAVLTCRNNIIVHAEFWFVCEVTFF